jgi:hypothetical protein
MELSTKEQQEQLEEIVDLIKSAEKKNAVDYLKMFEQSCISKGKFQALKEQNQSLNDMFRPKN